MDDKNKITRLHVFYLHENVNDHNGYCVKSNVFDWYHREKWMSGWDPIVQCSMDVEKRRSSSAVKFKLLRLRSGMLSGRNDSRIL